MWAPLHLYKIRNGEWGKGEQGTENGEGTWEQPVSSIHYKNKNGGLKSQL